jgi:hypothetical protein
MTTCLVGAGREYVDSYRSLYPRGAAGSRLRTPAAGFLDAVSRIGSTAIWQNRPAPVGMADGYLGHPSRWGDRAAAVRLCHRGASGFNVTGAKESEICAARVVKRRGGVVSQFDCNKPRPPSAGV